MFEYYMSAHMCHILIDMPSVWSPQEIVDNLKFIRKLPPNWNISEPSAKPTAWEDRCVSGTAWETPHPLYLRTHNKWMNYRMVDIYSCESRLANESTANISCEVRVNCGCTIVAPCSLFSKP